MDYELVDTVTVDEVPNVVMAVTIVLDTVTVVAAAFSIACAAYVVRSTRRLTRRRP